MELQENVLLAPYTTLRIGGPARFFTRITNGPDLLEAVHFAREHHLPLFALGGGSNLLVPDEGFPGVILHLALTADLTTAELPGKLAIQASAGLDWDALVRFTCEQGLAGNECLAGIPGLTGGSPIQNIGAYGQEVATTITNIHALDLASLLFVDLPVAECAFRYRGSIFNSTQRNRYLVTRVDFSFNRATAPNLTYADLAPLRGRNPTPLDVYHFVRQIRDRKGMLIDSGNPQDPTGPHPDSRSAGSFFKNPVVPPNALATIAASLALPEPEIPRWPTPTGELKLPAAWLIERAGFPKGFTLGPVGISTRHTLALVNRTGTATCADLLALRDLIMATVRDRFAISLEQEPVFLR